MGGSEVTERADEAWFGEAISLGARMGRYELRRIVGAGGMGVVFEADDPELDRLVAVKILRALSSSRGEARLRREGQTMARLTHANVLRIYDVGVGHGHVFVAMEFVGGGTLADWLARAPRTPEQIIAVFVQAGRGLAAAHDAGIVHRDFKPSNVLVGDDGRVLVTDFGLAQTATSVEPDDGASPELEAARPDHLGGLPATRTGERVGTPAFMAPEQHAGRVIDARADQFSFCVSLWRALFDVAPFEGTTVTELAEATRSGAVAAPPAAVASRASSKVRAALERGLRASPDERFASMHELLAILEPRSAVRARWWIAGAAGASLVAAASVWAIGSVTRTASDPCSAPDDRFAAIWNGQVASAVKAAFVGTKESYAAKSFDEVARQLDRRRTEWDAMRIDNCRATRVRNVQSDSLMDLRAACLDNRLDDVAAFVGVLRGADVETVRRAALEVGAIGDPAGCGDGAALTRRAPRPPEPTKRAEIAAIEREVSTIRAQIAAGRPRAVGAAADVALARARAVAYSPVTAEALHAAASVREAVEEFALAEQLLLEAVLAAEAGGDDALRFECEVALVDVVGYHLERDKDGTRHAEVATALLARLGSDTRRAANLARGKASAMWWNGHYAEAKVEAQTAIDLFTKLDPAGGDLVRSLHILAIVEDELGNQATALAIEERAIPLAIAALGDGHPIVASMMETASGALRRLDRIPEGRAMMQRALTMLQATYGPESNRVADGLLNLATMDLAEDKFEAAIPPLRRALAINEKVMGPEHTRVGMAAERLGSALSKAGHTAEAETMLQRALALHLKRFGADNPVTAGSHRKLAEHAMRTGNPARARTSLLEALRAIEVAQGKTSPRLARPLRLLGDAELALGQRASAIAAYERALAVIGTAAEDASYRAEIEAALRKLRP